MGWCGEPVVGERDGVALVGVGEADAAAAAFVARMYAALIGDVDGVRPISPAPHRPHRNGPAESGRVGAHFG